MHLRLRGFVGLAALALFSSPVRASVASIKVRLDLRGGLRELPIEGELVAVSAADGVERRWPMKEGATLALAPDTAWELTCSAAGLWCPRLEIRGEENPPGSRRVVALPVYRGVRVRATVRAPGGTAAPESGVVQGTIWEEGEPAGLQLLSRLNLEEGAFSFQAPAAPLDLRFAFGEWAPIYLWRLKAGASADGFDLGSLELFAGASVAGWVRDEETDLPVERATVTLAPLASEWAPKAGDLDHQTRSDAHGFFQIRGVAPGRYRLAASTGRSTPLVLDELEVLSDSETMLGALRLAPPIVGVARLTPPVDPEGGRWRLRLRPSRPLPEEAPIEATVGEDGFAELPGLRPASYMITVLTSSDDLMAGEEREIGADGVLEIAVPVVGIHGVVRLDDEPLTARTVLETGAADSKVFVSDAEGEFRGFIRRPRWSFLLASVYWKDGDEERSAKLELSPELPEQGDLELEIEVPNQNVSGIVVNGEGLPVAGARVTTSPAQPDLVKVAPAETGADGRFHVAGLGKQLYRVQAKRAGVGSSEIFNVDLGSGVGAGEVRLVLLPSKTVEGRVLTSQGEGLSGAYLDFETRGRSPASASTISDWSGAFSLELPEGSEDAVIRVFAPSQLLWSGCLRLEARGELLIQMPPLPGGTLLLKMHARQDLPPATGGQVVLVSDHGGIFSMGVLLNWQRRSRGETRYDPAAEVRTYTVPAVAPGNYALVWSGGQIWELAAAACSGAIQGRWGFLEAGGRLELDFDAEAHQQRRGSATGAE